MICGDLKDSVHIAWQQSGYTKFLCLWDSGAHQEHWTSKVGKREKDLRLAKEILYTLFN